MATPASLWGVTFLVTGMKEQWYLQSPCVRPELWKDQETQGQTALGPSSVPGGRHQASQRLSGCGAETGSKKAVRPTGCSSVLGHLAGLCEGLGSIPRL